MKKNWKEREIDKKKSKYIAEKLNISEEIATILCNRSIDTVEKAHNFLENNDSIVSPFKIQYIDKAISIINKIIHKKEKPKVFIIGDKDVDGITGIAIFKLMFEYLGFEINYDLPLENESYGISDRIYNNIIKYNPDLIITVDVGIKESEFCQKIKNLGIKIIITDHHEPPDILPEADAIVNPKIGNNKELASLSGAGVAYKLFFALLFSQTSYYNQYFLIKNNKNIEESIVIKNFIEKRLKNKEEIEDFIKNKKPTIINIEHENKPNIFELYKEIKDINYKTLRELARDNNIYYTKKAETKSAAGLFNKYIIQKIISKNQNINNALIYACLGSICDYMPFNTLENRALIKKGISLINTEKPENIRIAIKKDTIDVKDISFTWGPLLNSGGRLGNANISLEFIIEKNRENIKNIYETLTEINKKRKEIEETAYKKAISQLEKSITNNIITYSSNEIIKGITGIMATKISKKYGKTSFVFFIDENNEEVVGSGRTMLNINLIKLFNDCQDIFLRFGGHHKACGMTIKINYFEEFMNIIKEKDKNLEKFFESEDYYYYDLTINPKDINTKIIEYIYRLEPFGPEYEEPVFKSPAVHPIEITKIGQDLSHLKFKVKENPKINFLWWNKAYEYDNIKGNIIDIFYTLSLNTYNNKTSIDATVLDINII
ncbi:MAG TPA: single-stranded-DNA-specific exonuclease RecJ [Spirochaetota bacterium]|nr:single-stranded-DNA-specific exonuclease RecJ [Spirochaetota bacterium]HOM37753.1 single-stranded-DNA-specific exonuclease RecJ [Spirochaetota bacterium]HPQ49370.1 single-stranded-DNA-specific exonuclease RecJ [Spirochaetota bacterium]